MTVFVILLVSLLLAWWVDLAWSWFRARRPRGRLEIHDDWAQIAPTVKISGARPACRFPRRGKERVMTGDTIEVLRNPIWDRETGSYIEDDIERCPFPGCDTVDCEVHANLEEY